MITKTISPYEGYEEYLEHFGVKGMKWGIRRYQNTDGTLTEVGRKHIKRAKKASIKEFKRLGRAARQYSWAYSVNKQEKPNDFAAIRRSEKEMRKRQEEAYSWLRKMKKTFGDTVLNDVRDTEVIVYAENFTLAHRQLMQETKLSKLNKK